MTKKAALILALIAAAGLFNFSSSETQTDARIQALVERITPELIEIRRDIHAHPELAFEEKRTSAIVARYFKKLGMEVKTGIAETGVLGVLRGKKPGPVVGMRGDMDALPITEQTGLPFASKEKGIIDGQEYGLMHACGHDIHTTVLLGVAHVLSALRDDLQGTVLFVAQPAEERGGGARRMFEAGLFQDIRPEAMFAYHVHSSYPAGTITYVPGYSSANVDGFALVILSEGCHGAHPSRCVDPIAVGAQVVLGLQVMIAREIDVHNHTVITVGSFHAGSAPNIVPEKAELRTTVRSYGEDQRKLVRQKIERLIQNTCEAAGAEYELDYRFGSPSVYNNPALLAEILPTMERVLGGKEFLKEEKPGMGGEDFSHFALEVPSVMLSLGVCPKDVERNSVHSPTFVADEESIPVGVRVMATVIHDYLHRHTLND